MNDWTGGNCDHEELNDEHDLPWFDRRDKDFQALQEIILDPGLLESLKYYVRFRYVFLFFFTGERSGRKGFHMATDQQTPGIKGWRTLFIG